MQIDYDYILTDIEAKKIKESLRLNKYDVDVANFTITFSIYGKSIPATYWEPAEEPELEIEETELNFITGEDGIPIMLHHEDKAKVLDIINLEDIEEIEELCWEYAKNNVCEPDEPDDRY